MHLSTLSSWLAKIGSVHTVEIDLGLDRVRAVATKLNLLSPACPIIIVGGTNGKGSTVAGLAAIYQSAGYRVGTFTTPIFFKHNEQVRIKGEMVGDEAFCQAFEKIEAARGDISLTPFEFHTLAALIIFQSCSLDLGILEVGLGGRLDAVNIIDADVAVVTSIDIDHVQWLGATREAIAYEKAGIFRRGRPAVCGDPHPPQTLMDHAAKQGAPFFCQGCDFHYQEENEKWSWEYNNTRHADLPPNSLATQNMSTVLMTVTLLQVRLPVASSAIVEGLSVVKLEGRIQIKEGPVMEIYDVAHNPAAVSWLAKRLKTMPSTGKTHAVFSMLADKDIDQSIQAICQEIDYWYVAPLTGKRAATLDKLQQAFCQANVSKVTYFPSIKAAYEQAKALVQIGDKLAVFGSFHTLVEIRQ